MLDATWEAPDGTITPLDDYLDTYFQEVYLEADSLPLFAKLARHVLPDAVDDYAEQLERQIYEYTVEKPNYGKAAKRMYNLFRLTGRYEEAAYLRELFDEKATALYQVAALIRSLDEASGAGSEISPDTLRSQTDALIVERHRGARGRRAGVDDPRAPPGGQGGPRRRRRPGESRRRDRQRHPRGQRRGQRVLQGADGRPRRRSAPISSRSNPEPVAEALPDLYVSADIETDGPIPGEYSMLSFAFSLASRYDGSTFEAYEPGWETTFYVELKPISENFKQEALDVNGLDREALAVSGREPEDAMREAAEWIASHADGARPVLVLYPLSFDWSFLHWYFIRYTGESPFGHSSCIDIRTLYMARALTTFDQSGQQSMPPELLPTRPHTHHASDDAQEQAELFNRVFAWALGSGGMDVRS